MHTLYIILYIFLGLLVFWYLYILLFNKKKSSTSFGRKKKVIEIINKYPNITHKATRKIHNAVQEMSLFFYKNGEIDYETLLDTLVIIKRKNDDEKIALVIDIYIESIRTGFPYLHVSNSCSELFKQLDQDIKTSDFDKASSDLELLYKKSAETETLLKRRGKIEFWIGIVIGLIGIAVSCVTFFSN